MTHVKLNESECLTFIWGWCDGTGASVLHSHAFCFLKKRREYMEEVTFNGLTPSNVITHHSLHLCVSTCRCFTSRSLKGGERLAALSAGCLQERSGAAEAGTRQEPAHEERGRQHALAAAQLPPAGSAGHAEGSWGRRSHDAVKLVSLSDGRTLSDRWFDRATALHSYS